MLLEMIYYTILDDDIAIPIPDSLRYLSGRNSPAMLTVLIDEGDDSVAKLHDLTLWLRVYRSI